MRVHDEYLRVSKSDPARAKLLNIRYTGLQAYSIMEGYGRMKAGMRLYRHVSDANQGPNFGKLYAGISPLFQDAEQVREMLLRDVAVYMGWTGHYAANAAMPLHDSIHHDGWSGTNPKGYTRDPHIHDRFESGYVDLIGTSEADVLPYVSKDARYLDDPWKEILDYPLDSRNFVEAVYRVELRAGFGNKADKEAPELVYTRISAGAASLRDLVDTAWIESAKPVPTVKPEDRPENPRYNPAAGSAPAPEHR